MWPALEKIFAAPSPSSANAEHQAAVLGTALNVWIVAMFVLLAIIPFQPLSASQMAIRGGIGFTILLTLFVCRSLLHRGRVNLPSYVVLTVLGIGVSVFLAANGSIRAPLVSTYLLIVVMAGLLLGRRATWLAVALCALTIGGLIVAERAQWLTPRDTAVGMAQWINLVIMMSLAAVFIGISLRSRDQALALARRELEMRQNVEEALRRANDGLEQQVAARTSALQESEARFRALTDLSSDWYWEQDQDFRFTLMSGELLTRTGIDVAQHIGKTRWELAAVNLDDTDWAEHRACLERHEPFRDFEMRRPDRNGRMHWVSISGEPIFDDAGRFTGYRGVGRDITERKLREAQLLKLSSAIEQSPASVLITDAQGAIEYVNPEFERVTGYRAAEAIGQNPRMFKSGKVAAETYADMWNTILAGGVWRGEFVNRKKSGEHFWEEASISAIRGSDGATTHYVAVKADITERKRLEERMERRTAELATAMKELESFSYSLSHDLRAPVRAVTSFSQIVLEDHGAELPAEARQLIERIVKAGASMGEMIGGLLELSRISRGDIARRDTDLSRLAREVWDEAVLAQPGRKARLEAEDGVAACCDPVLVRNVLQNLLGNAFKYTRDAEDARVQFGKVERDGEAVFHVRDNGAGFDMAYANRLFGAFQRLHGANEFEGTGIGLATVQRIVERHGGRIWAEAAPGLGATFYFTLPTPQAHSPS
jgi:PAS domain S-box-containing protein